MAWGSLGHLTKIAEAVQTQREADVSSRRQAAFESNPAQTFRTGLGSFARIPFEHPPPPPPPAPDPQGAPQTGGGSEIDAETEQYLKDAFLKQQALDFANYFFVPTEDAAKAAASIFRRPEDNEGMQSLFAGTSRAMEAFQAKPEGGWPAFEDLPKEVQKALLDSAREGSLPVVQPAAQGGPPR